MRILIFKVPGTNENHARREWNREMNVGTVLVFEIWNSGSVNSPKDLTNVRTYVPLA